MKKPIPTTLAREDLAKLSIRSYEGFIRVVSTEDDLHEARRELHQEYLVGIDTESRPTFRKGEFYPTSLVQVATSKAVFLFSLQRIDCSEVLIDLLQNTAIVKTGIGLAQDFAKLKLGFPFEEKNVVDLSEVARHHGVKQPSVRTLTGLFLGFRITKGQSTSNWGREELSEKQIVYAATDAWVCRELFLRFQQIGFVDAEGRAIAKKSGG